MTRNTIYLLFGGPFALFIVLSLMGACQTREILRLIRRIDPDKARELSPVKTPFLRDMFWMNPFAFKRFVKSDDWRGNKLLEVKVEAYTRAESRARMVWSVMMLGVLVTALLVFLDVI